MNFEKPEKSDFWKNEKNCWRYHHFTHVYQKPQSYEVQFLRYGVRQFFLVIFGHFLPLFSPLPNNPENQNFEKMKKASGDVIILNLCNKKHDHMMYAYSDMECLHRHNFLSFQAIFCSFAPLLTPEIKICNKCKKSPGDIILLHMCTINQDHMMYGSWDMKFNRQIFFVILGKFFLSSWAIFCPFVLFIFENIKNEKKPWRYHNFAQMYQKSWSSALLFQRYGAWRM